MKKYLYIALTGVLFGIIMTKSEAISWFRIQEMFRFQSFHMYGIIGSAVLVGILLVLLIKNKNVTTFDGHFVELKPKDKGWKRYLFGGLLFGFGWALTGACPGPMYVLVGNSIFPILIVIASAIFGTFLYGVLKKHLPH